MLRSSGAAVLGAVRVTGGGLLVNPPRLPELRPPPTRASASVATSASAASAASPSTSGRKRKRNDVMFPLRIARRLRGRRYGGYIGTTKRYFKSYRTVSQAARPRPAGPPDSPEKSPEICEKPLGFTRVSAVARRDRVAARA